MSKEMLLDPIEESFLKGKQVIIEAFGQPELTVAEVHKSLLALRDYIDQLLEILPTIREHHPKRKIKQEPEKMKQVVNWPFPQPKRKRKRKRR